jgi:hypothetical protein
VCVDPTVIARVEASSTFLLLLGIKLRLSNTQPVNLLSRLILLYQYDLSLRCGNEIVPLKGNQFSTPVILRGPG